MTSSSRGLSFLYVRDLRRDSIAKSIRSFLPVRSRLSEMQRSNEASRRRPDSNDASTT